MAESTKATNTPSTHRVCDRRRPIRLPPKVVPKTPTRTEAASGASGTISSVVVLRVWLMLLCSALEGVEFVDQEVGLVAEQQHQDRQADRRLRRGDRQDEEHEDLSVHVAQVIGERDEVHVDGQQHQLDRHQQHDQVAPVQEDADHREAEQHGAQREEMSEGESHALFSAAPARGAAAVVGGILIRFLRWLARTRTCWDGSVYLLSLRRRSVSAIAAMMPTSRITAATSRGYRYWLYSSLPSSRVLENWAAPAAATGAAGTAPGSSPMRKPPISTAAISSAISTPTLAASGKCFQNPARTLSTLMSSIITTNRNST